MTKHTMDDKTGFEATDEAMGLRPAVPTPGPWFAIWNDSYWEINVADDRYAKTVAVVWANDGPTLAEPDARLIAATQDMLAALRSVADWHDKAGLPPFPSGEISAAIAKATGGTP